MRKIVYSGKEKNKKNKQIIFAIFLVGLMLFSILAYAFNFLTEEIEAEEIEYQNHKFYKQEQSGKELWITEINGNGFIFSNDPRKTEDIKMNIGNNLNNLNKYYQKPLYIYSENEEASKEIYFNIAPFSLRTSMACLDKENCLGDYPIKNCSDNFIIIRESEENKINAEENCVFIEGNYENLSLITDEFVLKTIGIK